jgi:trypsin-like peptidase/SIR2-like protein
MEKRTFDDLISDVRQRRVSGELPPVLLLGAGASAESGIGAMPDVYKEFNSTDFDSFTKAIGGYSADERYRKLFQFLQTRDPSKITPGYRALASLCAAAYFDLILTTNFDPLMDDALAAAQLWRKDYLLLVNTVIRNDWLRELLPARQPRVKVIKLHGDLFHRAMAWTVKEMDAFLADISPVLAAAVKQRDVLVVGHSLRDRRIRGLVMKNARTIWFTHPEKTPDHLKADKRVRAVIDPKCKFESLFVLLAKGLEVAVEPEQALAAVAAPPVKAARAPRTARSKTVKPASVPGAQTVDDLIASIVAIEGPGGVKMSTGFVLAEPRVIITDGHPIAALGQGQQHPTTVTVVTADGKRHHDAIVHRDPSHPFGVVAIEAFPDVKKFPGLRLNSSRPAAGTHVHIGVAAGERVGVSSGRIRNPREREVEITPVGPVPHLVAVDAEVTPGSSGAPVVDADLTVRGYIVAGGGTQALMYPSYRWAAALHAIQAAAAPKRKTVRKRTRRNKRNHS